MKPNGQPVKAEIPTQAINWFIFYGKIALQLTSYTRAETPVATMFATKQHMGKMPDVASGQVRKRKKKSLT